MKRKTPATYVDIEAQVRRARLQRSAYLGDLIGSGLAALMNWGVRPLAAIARTWRAKERLAPR